VLLQVPIDSSSVESSVQRISIAPAWLLSRWWTIAALVAGVMLACMAAALVVRLTAAKPANATTSITTTAAGVSTTAAATAAAVSTSTSHSSANAVSLNSLYIDIAALDATVDRMSDSSTSNSTAAAAAAASIATAAAAAATATATASSSLFWDVMNVLIERQAVPQELWCVSKCVNLLVRDIMPITVTIAAGTSAAIMQSLFDRESVKHVHIDGDNIQPDVIAAIADELHLEEAEWRAVHEPHTLWRSSSVKSFTLANFQQWRSDSVVQRLLEQTPHSVHTLRVVLQHADDDYYYQFGCPHSVKTLVLHNCAWTVEFNAGGQLAALHMEGVLRFSIDLPATLHTVVFKDVVTDGIAMLPELPIGVTSLDLSESGIVHPNDIPRMPTTLTDIRWPNGYVQPAVLPQHAQWHGAQGD
jgi:hypothetical protein